MHLVRYTAWDGTQQVRLSADEVFEKLSEYLSFTDDVQQALDWLLDRKSTRLNSSHTVISYAVFCLKKKNITKRTRPREHAGRCKECEESGKLLYTNMHVKLCHSMTRSREEGA